MELTQDALVGAWDLVDWRIEYDDGRPSTHPFGTDATGQITYTADGRMSAVIQQAGRQPLGAPSPRQAPAEACRAAYTSFFCYAGSWSLDGECVVHHLTLALNPAMLGSEQRRLARLEGETLELSAAEPIASGVTRTHRIRWRRVAR